MQRLGFSPKICKGTRAKVCQPLKIRAKCFFTGFLQKFVLNAFSQAFRKVAEFFFECFVKPRWFYDANVRDILVD